MKWRNYYTYEIKLQKQEFHSFGPHHKVEASCGPHLKLREWMDEPTGCSALVWPQEGAAARLRRYTAWSTAALNPQAAANEADRGFGAQQPPDVAAQHAHGVSHALSCDIIIILINPADVICVTQLPVEGSRWKIPGTVEAAGARRQRRLFAPQAASRASLLGLKQLTGYLLSEPSAAVRLRSSTRVPLFVVWTIQPTQHSWM